jgi:hypothetical protein
MSVDDEVLAAQLARVRRERDTLSKIVALGLDTILQVRVDLASRGIAVDAATDRAIAKFDRLARSSSMRRTEHG